MKDLTVLLKTILHEDAVNECRIRGGSTLLPEHVILGIIKKGDGLAYTVLHICRINLLTFQVALEHSISEALSKGAAASADSSIYDGVRLSAVLGVAEGESRLLSNSSIGTEHFLLACAQEEGSCIQRYFQSVHILLGELRTRVKEAQLNLQKRSVIIHNILTPIIHNMQDAAGSSQSIIVTGPMRGSTVYRSVYDNEKRDPRKDIFTGCATDLTALARAHKLGPIVGRDEETQRLIQVLSRSTKNNPLLLGEPGVGKTAIVEGLALRIVQRRVPHRFLDKRVLALDIATLVAGSKLRGEFEEKVKRVIQAVKDAKNILLFIDEMHTMVGAGGSEGTMDAASLIKGALSQEGFMCIGATTIKDYHRYLEKDAALMRRFQIIKVEEPSVENTICILEGAKDRLQKYHKVVYEEGVIPLVVQYSKRYITDRFLPDKALDVLDEAGAAKRIACDTYSDLLLGMQQDVEHLKAEHEEALREHNEEVAATVRGKALSIQDSLTHYKKQWTASKAVLSDTVTLEDIKAVLHSMTSIPMEQLDAEGVKRLLTMEDTLKLQVIGQDAAVKAIAGCIRRSRSLLCSPKRPLGSFIFLGPTGVGKTHLAKKLAEFLFGNEDALIRMDMSDYMEKQDSSRLVGAPPGYVGYDEGGVLTEQVLKKPYSVLLLDEIEKAHPVILNLLLQILEEGELLDNFGHKVNFRNCVIIMTSNVGAKDILGESTVGFRGQEELAYNDIAATAKRELKKVFTPEVLNRIDEAVVFNPLSKQDIAKIVDLSLKELRVRLQERKLDLAVSAEARDYLSVKGYDPLMGARPLRRLILKQIEEPMAILLLEHSPKDGTVVYVDTLGEGLCCSLREALSIGYSAESSGGLERTIKA